jgi:hypothetical protein
MKKSLTMFFQGVVVLIALGAVVFLLWAPHLEGRNVDATAFEIYFKDPFLAYAYIASIAFFVALYNVFKLLGYMGRNELLSPASIKALRIIKYCALSLIGFIVVGVVWLLSSESDDRPPIIAMGFITSVGCIVVATLAGKFEKKLRKTVTIQK